MSLEKQLNLLKKRRGVTSTQNRAPAGRRRVGARTKATGNPNGEGTGGQEGAGDAAPARSGTHRTHYLGGPSQTKAAPAQNPACHVREGWEWRSVALLGPQMTPALLYTKQIPS
jgi:hypothetical protein